MKILVQKFGGTSVATDETRDSVIKKIINGKKKCENVVVVVSAMGRLGLPYATDSLLHLVNHKNTKLSPREIDLLMSVGEIISATVTANLLLEQGIKSCALTGGGAGIITDNNFNNAEVISIHTDRLTNLLKEGYVPVVAGFQGLSTSNDITTIGRGGSDTTAALLGEALKAQAVEIYTDVDGIMTADPRICPSAKIINELSYNEVFQMADSGAKVIHPRAVEVARRAGIPLVIKNTFNNSKGTNIIAFNRLEKKKSIKEKLITSIAHREDRIQFIITGDINYEDFFCELADKNVSIDIINILPDKKVFTIDEKCKDSVLRIINKYNAKYSYIDDCCKVTVIGERMTGVPGVMARIIKCLSSCNIEILQTADSLSTIACLIKKNDLALAIKALHTEFMLD